MNVKDYILINGYKHILYQPDRFTPEASIENSRKFYAWLDSRRSVREYSNKAVPKEVIQNILMAASTAPSGAHKQPWTFCAVSDTKLKHQIRLDAEAEERETYNNRMSERWKQDLAPLGTDANKPFIDEAPWIIVGFKRVYEHEGDQRHNNYYVNESMGIASGMLITAIHNAGLVTLTHTPSPMNFLQKILKRPENEKCILLIPVGYPADEIMIPDLERKTLKEVMHLY